MISPVLTMTPAGLYCPQGDFHIDPWRAVQRAIITHAHSDHARKGHGSYLCHRMSEHVLRLRLGNRIQVQTLDYNQRLRIGEIDVTLFPAGHIPGSAQVRLSHPADVCVVTGDYKTEDDGLCEPFTPVKCNTLISESTFGLPVFRWEAQSLVVTSILEWWSANIAQRKHSVVECYSLGKAQRLVSLLSRHGQILLHPTIWNTHEALRVSGAQLPPVAPIDLVGRDDIPTESLLVAPPGSNEAPWARRLKRVERAQVSGWMLLRRRLPKASNTTGFVMSDHADCDQLISAIKASAPDRVFLTHGYSAALARLLESQHGIDARTLETEFQGEAVAVPSEDE